MRTVLALAALFSTAATAYAETLIVHEWGTFTSLQDENGRTIGGINTDEERLPGFVHDLRPVMMVQHSDLAPRFIKFAPVCSDEVTMRLETPVVYFHLPAGTKEMRVDLKVAFRGGILSQYYPDARIAVDAKEITDPKQWHYRRMSARTTGTLEWNGVVVGGKAGGPQTTSPIWLAPRQVDAAPVATTSGEREKYLFYRGLGHLDAPLVTKRSSDGATLSVSARSDSLDNTKLTSIPRLWLADLRGDGTAAMRSAPAVALDAAHQATSLPATFMAADYSAACLADLRSGLHAGLVGDGLNGDEADALLNTWQESYFKTAGLRLFFLVPRAWTDRYLPMTVTPAAQIERALMGRIELISPGQRQAITRIAAGPVSENTWFERFMQERVYLPAGTPGFRPDGAEIHRRIYTTTDRGLLAGIGMPMPDDYRAYLALGRFRDALLLDEQRQHPDPELKRFIDTYQLEGDGITKQGKQALLDEAQRDAIPSDAAKAP